MMPAAARKKGALRLDEAAPSGASAAKHLVRDFQDPYLELLRLLHEAAEVEHALMLQYLSGAFSLKPDYQDIAGYGDPNAHDLIGVAIQEMQHLSAVNRLLVELGSAPHLARQDFPYEPDIYPFEFNLEPLTRRSVAQYTYTEAPAGATDPRLVTSPEDAAFVRALLDELGPGTRPNHVGSLYDTLIATLDEVTAGSVALTDHFAPWRERLFEIQGEGEVDHFHFFKSLFLTSHDGFRGRRDVWSLPPDAQAYPSFLLAWNPSAYVGHANQIQDPTALALGWLGNLHYWTTLLLLDHAYREGDEKCIDLARMQMLGPISRSPGTCRATGSACRSTRSAWVTHPGSTAWGDAHSLHMLNEANQLADGLETNLPGDIRATHAPTRSRRSRRPITNSRCRWPTSSSTDPARDRPGRHLSSSGAANLCKAAWTGAPEMSVGLRAGRSASAWPYAGRGRRADRTLRCGRGARTARRQTNERPTRLAQALGELGRIVKTIYMLTLIDDADERRRTWDRSTATSAAIPSRAWCSTPSAASCGSATAKARRISSAPWALSST